APPPGWTHRQTGLHSGGNLDHRSRRHYGRGPCHRVVRHRARPSGRVRVLLGADAPRWPHPVVQRLPRRVFHLVVVPAEVGYAAGWWVALQRGVAAVMITGVEEG